MTERDERVVHVQKHAPFSRRFFFEARNGGWQAYVSPFKFGMVEFSPQRCPNLWQSSEGPVGTENPLGSSLLIMQCMFLGVICFAHSVVFGMGSSLVQFSSWWDLKTQATNLCLTYTVAARTCTLRSACGMCTWGQDLATASFLAKTKARLAVPEWQQVRADQSWSPGECLSFNSAMS